MRRIMNYSDESIFLVKKEKTKNLGKIFERYKTKHIFSVLRLILIFTLISNVRMGSNQRTITPSSFEPCQEYHKIKVKKRYRVNKYRNLCLNEITKSKQERKPHINLFTHPKYNSVKNIERVLQNFNKEAFEKHLTEKEAAIQKIYHDCENCDAHGLWRYKGAKGHITNFIDIFFKYEFDDTDKSYIIVDTYTMRDETIIYQILFPDLYCIFKKIEQKHNGQKIVIFSGKIEEIKENLEKAASIREKEKLKKDLNDLIEKSECIKSDKSVKDFTEQFLTIFSAQSKFFKILKTFVTGYVFILNEAKTAFKLKESAVNKNIMELTDDFIKVNFESYMQIRGYLDLIFTCYAEDKITRFYAEIFDSYEKFCHESKTCNSPSFRLYFFIAHHIQNKNVILRYNSIHKSNDRKPKNISIFRIHSEILRFKYAFDDFREGIEELIKSQGNQIRKGFQCKDIITDFEITMIPNFSEENNDKKQRYTLLDLSKYMIYVMIGVDDN